MTKAKRRLTNERRSSNNRNLLRQIVSGSHLLIWVSFVIPHSDFVISKGSLLRFEHLDKRLLWNIDFSNAFHPFFSFFLFFQQFAFAGNIAAVAFRGHIFS